MSRPSSVLNSARSRAAEITWWNRRLTKLRSNADIQNLDSFFQEQLIETKGPYVEFVDAPEADSKSARERLSDFEYSQDVIESLETELFGGKQGSLYQHQRETIEAIEQTDDDVMLTVPTAGGKTESFFLPVLNSCDQSEEEGTKAIILYPMKTLAVDQLNRFISYLYQVNKSRSREDSITIGIWDGDTPNRVGSQTDEIESGSHLRGLEDPITGEKLQIGEDGIAGSKARDYEWLKVTRDRIKDGADILLSTPEALDHILVHDSEDVRSVLGNSDNAHPVEHIVFDEAHVWSGVSGAGIQLLVQRLKYFYRESNPQVSLVSATIKNPTSLASSLTGSEEADIQAISFTGKTPPTTETPDYGRFVPCGVDELVLALASSIIYDSQEDVVTALPELENAIHTHREIGLLTKEGLSIPDEQDWLLSDIRSAVTDSIDRIESSNPNDVLLTEEGQEELIEQVLEYTGAGTPWFDYICHHVPEVATLREWAKGETVGAVGFRKLSDIQQYIDEQVEGDSEGHLRTIFALGKLSGIITDRHHSFLKPPQSVFYCDECQRISTGDLCSHCGNEELPELQFCDNCHYPYLIHSSEDREDDEMVPLGGSTPQDRCLDCSENLYTSDIGVPTSSLLSYMVSEICRETRSGKVLNFSDSHSGAESIAQRIQNMEYGLAAESLYVQKLLENDGTVPYQSAANYVQNELTAAYFEPFLSDHLDQRGPAYNIIQGLQSQITEKANLYNSRHLLQAALVTSDVVYQNADSTLELIVGHELYKRFANSESVSFQDSNTKFYFLTVEKIHDRVEKQLPECSEDIEQIINKFIKLLYEADVIHEKPFDDVRRRLNERVNDESTYEELWDRFIQAGDEFDDLVDPENLDSGLLHRNHSQDTSDLRLLTTIARCNSCLSIYPVIPGDPLDCCFECGSNIKCYPRFSINDDGSYSGTGVAEIDPNAEWPLDHWASDIMAPLNQEREPRFVTVGIHKSNIPPALRGIIEEGFRKSPPEINVISSTPTMELGVDIGTLETVTQSGIPPTLTNYVQRSGRTGRSQGSSSLVMTAIQGKDPVDNHFYQDLSGFFGSFEPVRVPSASEFEPIVASHVVTEVIGFLARTQHQSNSFERNYKITQRGLSSEEFVAQIESNIEALRDLVVNDRREVLIERIEEIFGKDGVRAFSKVFEEDGSLNLLHRISQSYSPLADSEGSSNYLRNRDNRLNIWLSRIGYLGSYRTFGHSFPIEIDGYRDDVTFQSTGRLYQMFPGSQNERGAVFQLGGESYIVNDVSAGSELASVELCTNEECDQRFEAYGSDLDTCPHCDAPLKAVSVHEIGSMHARKAGTNEARWTTRGFPTTYTTRLDAPDTESEPTTLAGLPCEVTVDEFEVTRFIYAFERRHSSSNTPDIVRSEAVREGIPGENYAPIGQQYQTSGIKLDFQKAEITDRLDGEISWGVVTASLEQVLKRSIAIAGGFDLGDFEVDSRISDEQVSITITDNQFGGSGVAWQLGLNLSSMLEDKLKDILDCDNCTHYCEQCLLLPRTPPMYLDHNLLKRQMLKSLFEFETSHVQLGSPRQEDKD